MPLEAFRKQAHTKHAKTEKKGNVREKNCKIFFTVLKSQLGIDELSQMRLQYQAVSWAWGIRSYSYLVMRTTFCSGWLEQ
jgi:hypothetical protein